MHCPRLSCSAGMPTPQCSWTASPGATRAPQIAPGASNPAPCWCANIRASGTPSPLWRTASSGATAHTGASPSSRGPLRGPPGAARVSLASGLTATGCGMSMLLHAVVHPANVQDRDGAILVMATLFGMFPFLQKLFADGGYQGPEFTTALATVRPHMGRGVSSRQHSSELLVVPEMPLAAKKDPKLGLGMSCCITSRRSELH